MVSTERSSSDLFLQFFFFKLLPKFSDFIYSDRYELILSDVTITIQSYDEKTAEDLHEDCVKISGP